MKPWFITALALAAVTFTPAAGCDADTGQADAEECPAVDGSDDTFVVAPRLTFAAPEGAPPPAEYTLREQGPPENLVITSYGGAKILRSAFAKLVMSAQGQKDPPLTCTLSWYQPDTTKSERVLGLGCSMLAPGPLWDSYRQTFLDNGGVPVGP